MKKKPTIFFQLLFICEFCKKKMLSFGNACIKQNRQKIIYIHKNSQKYNLFIIIFNFCFFSIILYFLTSSRRMMGIVFFFWNFLNSASKTLFWLFLNNISAMCVVYYHEKQRKTYEILPNISNFDQCNIS